MRYEIQKKLHIDGEPDSWSMIACTDVWAYATKIVDALNFFGDGRYRVCDQESKGGEEGAKSSIR